MPIAAADGTRLRALAAAGFLLLAGALSGVVADRVLFRPEPAAAAPLTARGMAEQLSLGPVDEARIVALLDSMHAGILAATRYGPDSLLVAANSAHERLEVALPPEVLPRFRAWMREHHQQMMERVEAQAHRESPAH